MKKETNVSEVNIMKVLFVHDHKFRLVKNKLYSTGGLSDEVLSRYTSIFGEVTVIARVVKEENADEKYSLIKNPLVNIIDGQKLKNKNFLSHVENADCIISRMPSFYGAQVIKLAKKLNKPYLIEMVGCPWDSLWNHSWKGKLVAPYLTHVTKKTSKNASHVLYVTNKFLQQRYPTTGKSIGCSDVALQQSNDKTLENRLLKIKDLEKHKKPIILGTIAAVNVKYKGQQYIIEALSDLRNCGFDVEYHVAGSGDQKYLIDIARKNNVLDKVKFLGSLPHLEIFSYLDCLDIYIQPSKQEGLPRALVEAMSRACPSIGSETGGIPELLNNKFIFKRGSSNDFIKVFKTMDIEAMKAEAISNFEKSKEYNFTKLNDERNKFYNDFANTVKEFK